jgi:aspartokinase/homoserine dehydrogenase 1
MKILKFGGSSLANANKILSVARIIEHEMIHHQIGVVASAPRGVTNQLINLVRVLQQKK